MLKMLGEIIPFGEIVRNGEISPTTEINWPSMAEVEEGTESSWFPETVGEKGIEINWSPVAVGEKGKAKVNGVQAFSPVGLKVLVVDDNRVCLAVLEKMLNRCKYTVTTCNSAAMALSLVQDNRTPFDLVLCDVHMPGMDGFKLLEALVPARELPVIMMSSDDETDVVMKGITRGACDYFLKPVCLQRLRTIWQHVFRRREMIEAAKDGDCTDFDIVKGSKLLSDRDNNSRKRKGKEEAVDDPVEFVNGNKKKTRLVWTTTLHKQFVDAVKNLGTANAVPKQILEKMNVKGISRENVASHLQKYRKYLIDQETIYDDAKDAGHSYPLEAFQARGHFGGSIEIQSGTISTLPYNIPSLHSPNAVASLQSPNPMSSHHATNTISSLHSLNTIPSLHSSNTIPSLNSPNTIPSLRSSNTIPSLNPSADTMTSLHSPHALPHSLLSPHTMSSLQSPHHRVNLHSHQTTRSFPSGQPLVPSLHSQQTIPSFPSGRTGPNLHSMQSMSSGYSVNTELYPFPSQSFQAVETGNLRSDVGLEQLVPSFDVASSSSFPQRIRQFPNMVDVYAPPVVAPASYNTEYQV